MKCGASHAPAQKSTPKKPKMNMGGYMAIKKKKMLISRMKDIIQVKFSLDTS